MVLGRHKTKQAAKSEPKVESYFYPKSDDDHVSICSKIMLSPSNIASPSTDVTWGYRCKPGQGEWNTAREGAAMAGPPSPSKRGGCQGLSSTVSGRGGGCKCSSPTSVSAEGLRGVVRNVASIDCSIDGVVAHAPACCVVPDAAAGADSDQCIAGTLARVATTYYIRDS